MWRRSAFVKAKAVQGRRHDCTAFTLAELLSVLIILTGLTLVILSVISGTSIGRARSNTAPCASNQRQIAMACLAYAQDYDDVLPPVVGARKVGTHAYAANWLRSSTTGDGTTVPGLLEDYFWHTASPHHLRRCPGTPITVQLTYRYNDLAATARLSADLPAPQCSVLLMDGDDGPINAGHGSPSDHTGADCQPDDATGGCRSGTGSIVHSTALVRHDGGANYAFLDGHVKWLVPAAVYFPPAASGSRVHREKNGPVLGPTPGSSMIYGGKKYGATFFIR